MVAHFENRKRAEVMMQSRLTKARRGEAVSNLPIGWIQNPDSSYDFDPEAEATIRLVIETFWQTRSAHATVRALAKAGIQIPYRDRQRICFRKPSVCRVLRILKNLNYSGTYFYGKTQSHPGGPTLPNGQSQRIKVPEEKWIKIFDHHPAYMTKEQQEEIKSILNKNQYLNRDRPGKGPAPMQGLLRCGRCGANLSVTYPTKHSHYHCSRGHGYGEKPCTTFMSDEFDRFILRQVFKTLKTPPVEMLKSALEASRKKKLTRLSWIESERERLGHEQRKAEDRADITRGSLPRVHFDALAKLEKVREEQERFEQKISLEPPSPTDESEQELDELCSIASDIPELWNHPAVTNQDKKEILRCVIDHVLVSTDKKKIDAKIVWQSGTETSFSIWQRGNWGSLIGELHAQKLTASEIQEHLAAGKTSTGQVLNITQACIYTTLRNLRLKPWRLSTSYLLLAKKVGDLYREGRSLKWTMRYFKEQGFVNAWGRPWTAYGISALRRMSRDKPESAVNVHHRAIAEARERGLTAEEMAVEFNGTIRRKGGPWTAHNIKQTWSRVNRFKVAESRKDQAARS